MKPIRQHWTIPASPVSDDPNRWDLHGLTKIEHIAALMMQTARRRHDDGDFISVGDRANSAVRDAVALLTELDRWMDSDRDGREVNAARMVMVSHMVRDGGRWKKEDKGVATFHGWGMDFEELETGPFQFSTAIVEYPDGTLDSVAVHLVRVIEPGDGREDKMSEDTIQLPILCFKREGQTIVTTFHDPTGEKLGTLLSTEKGLSFEGKADESAEVFFECLVKMGAISEKLPLGKGWKNYTSDGTGHHMEMLIAGTWQKMKSTDGITWTPVETRRMPHHTEVTYGGGSIKIGKPGDGREGRHDD